MSNEQPAGEWDPLNCIPPYNNIPIFTPQPYEGPINIPTIFGPALPTTLELAKALRDCFADTNGRVPTKPLDELISRYEPSLDAAPKAPVSHYERPRKHAHSTTFYICACGYEFLDEKDLLKHIYDNGGISLSAPPVPPSPTLEVGHYEVPNNFVGDEVYYTCKCTKIFKSYEELQHHLITDYKLEKEDGEQLEANRLALTAEQTETAIRFLQLLASDDSTHYELAEEMNEFLEEIGVKKKELPEGTMPMTEQAALAHNLNTLCKECGARTASVGAMDCKGDHWTDKGRAYWGLDKYGNKRSSM